MVSPSANYPLFATTLEPQCTEVQFEMRRNHFAEGAALDLAVGAQTCYGGIAFGKLPTFGDYS
jgi:hypothetical protein